MASTTSSIASSSLHSLSSEYGFSEVEIYKDDRIGSGAFGVVCKAKCDRLLCAAKFLHPTFLVPGNWAVDKFVQECSFLASLRHPHIVQFLGLHTDPSGQVALLLELMKENLTTFLDRYKLLPYRLLVNISHDITLALLYLHNNGIIHRDLSSNNVLLLGNSCAKIGDFGMSKLLPQGSPHSSLTQVPGCPLYMPPEAWISPPLYTDKLDVFSLGVLMVQMITCQAPNPGVLELMVEDDRSPTGFMKLPVSELDRRSEDIASIPSDHPLRLTVLECLENRPNLRPTTVDLSCTFETMKSSVLYKEEPEVEVSAVTSSDGVESMEKKLEDKELKIARDKLSHLEKQLQVLQEKLAEKDRIIDELKEERKKGKKDTLAKSRQFSLSSLSPEVLQVIASDRQSQVFNLTYEINQGRVVFHNPGSEGLDQSTRIFLQVYKHFFNSGDLRVDFVPVPDFFPTQLIDKCLVTLSSRLNASSYNYLKTPNVIKVVSKSLSSHKVNVKLLDNVLNLRKELGEGRTLTLKKGDIVTQDVSIIVSSANACLDHTWGVSAAINVASQFEVQRHCDEYIAKHSFVEVGNVAHTEAGGSLKCSWVIHAVGPAGVFLKEGKIDLGVVKEMKQLTHRILHRADKLNAQSVAIPAISTGSLMLVASVAAKGILEGITSYCFSSSSRLVDVRVVILKETIFHEFVEKFITLLEPLTKKITSPKQQPIRPIPVLDMSKSSDQSVSSCKQQ